MRDKLGLAVVGCGRIARQHLTALRDLADSIDLTAVVSRNEERVRSYAKEFGARKWYRTMDEAFGDPEIEAVLLCLPHHVHAEASIKAAKARRHILVEKPMANTFEEAQDMVRAARENNVKLMVGQSRRYFRAVMESIRRSGEIGKPLQITTVWTRLVERPPTDWWASAEKTGGLVMALNGSHAVDYILWLLKETPIRVYAETYSNNPIWEGEDEATVVMGFESGAIATVHLSFNDRLFGATKKDYYYRHIIGTKGTMDLIDEDTLKINGETVVDEERKPEYFIVQMREQLKEFAAAIRENREPLASGEEVMQSIKVLEAARRSASEHQVINL
ncbi:MAG: Gfo/Idh/MocA family protein [bacterium]